MDNRLLICGHAVKLASPQLLTMPRRELSMAVAAIKDADIEFPFELQSELFGRAAGDSWASVLAALGDGTDEQVQAATAKALEVMECFTSYDSVDVEAFDPMQPKLNSMIYVMIDRHENMQITEDQDMDTIESLKLSQWEAHN